MHRGAEVEGLVAATGGVPFAEAPVYRLHYLAIRSNRLAEDGWPGFFQHLAYFFAAWNLAGAGTASVIGEQEQIAGEEGRMRATQVEQHAVIAGNRDDPHAGHTRSGLQGLQEKFLLAWHQREYRREIRCSVKIREAGACGRDSMSAARGSSESTGAKGRMRSPQFLSGLAALGETSLTLSPGTKQGSTEGHG
jgi:hypothetical protein